MKPRPSCSGREDDRTLGESGVLTPHRDSHNQENRGQSFAWSVVDDDSDTSVKL